MKRKCKSCYLYKFTYMQGDERICKPFKGIAYRTEGRESEKNFHELRRSWAEDCLFWKQTPLMKLVERLNNEDDMARHK